ncbi:RnfABCDGE type electron transport complex subunit D [Suttonella sp. R2A3]|uniref:RnfABCDGE type electron transport complex subunit D n=1 Tax=Suttonella sp. R2A3 TaxID=2908648 RepID=UPI001F339861|nr:RnfABCDGE type electron transport complex subunit D [Suttonella sp. R2A3]UJF24283.1 RnfABCDGE type electron transport complex subunit D [Suttonella sp. R2A3]
MTSAPYIHIAPSMRSIMWRVCAGLLPGVALLIYFEGARWLGLLAFAAGVALLSEGVILLIRRKARLFGQLSDGSAVLSALLLVLCLPPSVPLWLIAIGIFFALVFGKQLYGGLGMNIFNPAMVGYCFLLVSFPVLMSQHSIDWLPLSSLWQSVDASTGATLLDTSRMDRIAGESIGTYNPWQASIMSVNLAWLAGGLWLAWQRCLDWRIVAGVLLGGFITAAMFWGIDGERYLDPITQLFSGALIFGACFIATDPVSAATTPLGRWVYALLIGVLTICIRNLGNFPDGVAFAVLLANACVPLIDPLTQPRYR